MNWCLRIFINTLLLMFLFTLVFPHDLYSKGRGGSFGRSRTGSWGRSNSGKYGSGWNKSSKPKMFSRSGMKPKQRAAADKALHRKAKMNGTAFKTRSEATKSFQSKYGNQYTSKFPSKPNKRPDYIPKTTKDKNGFDRRVVYDPGKSSYGYWVGSNWMAYSVFSDILMMDMLMSRHHYHYGGAGAPLVSLGTIKNIIIILILAALFAPTIKSIYFTIKDRFYNHRR